VKKLIARVASWLGTFGQIVAVGLVALAIILVASGLLEGQIAVVSAVFAALAAMASWASVRETKKERLSKERPYILGFFDFPRGQILVFHLENFGNGPAQDIKVQFDPPPKTFSDEPINELPMFANAIDFLPPGGKRIQMIDTGPSYFGSDQPQQLNVTARYKDVRGKEYEYSLRQDISTWKGSSVIFGLEDYAEKIANELEKLRKSIQALERQAKTEKLLKKYEEAQKTDEAEHDNSD
jgi:hypothetical protein